MKWIMLVQALLGLLSGVTKLLSDRRLIKAEEAKALAESLREHAKRVEDAVAARFNTPAAGADSVRDDPYNRS